MVRSDGPFADYTEMLLDHAEVDVLLQIFSLNLFQILSLSKHDPNFMLMVITYRSLPLPIPMNLFEYYVVFFESLCVKRGRMNY